MYERNKNKLVKVKPESNICRYDPTNKHHSCKHPQYCIFNQSRIELDTSINELENRLENLRLLNNYLLNGELIYVPEFEDYYDVYYDSLLGEVVNNTDVIRLKSAVKGRISVVESELNGLYDFKNKVLDGKIGGYGYEF